MSHAGVSIYLRQTENRSLEKSPTSTALVYFLNIFTSGKLSLGIHN